MYYETIKDYLIEEVRKPIIAALDKNDKKEVMEIVDFELQRHIECNAFSKAFEDYTREKGIEVDIPIIDYVNQYVKKYLYEPNFEK